MRKRKLVVSVVAALAVSVGLASVAKAVITAQTITTTSTKSHQDKKVAGPGDISVTIDTFETPPTPADQTAQHTDVDFDKDFVFSGGNLPTCTEATLEGKSTADAIAACPGAVVGNGDARLCSPAGGCGAASAPAVVTAFNGVPEGGNPVLYLHSKAGGIAAAAPPLVLKGVLIDSPLGAPYGKRLSVDVDDTNPLHLTRFFTNVGVLKNGVVKKTKGKKNKKTGKRKVVKTPQYYVMAKCSDKQWEFRSETTFRGGGPTMNDTHAIPCTQKKAKKKKKKKKK